MNPSGSMMKYIPWLAPCLYSFLMVPMPLNGTLLGPHISYMDPDGFLWLLMDITWFQIMLPSWIPLVLKWIPMVMVFYGWMWISHGLPWLLLVPMAFSWLFMVLQWIIMLLASLSLVLMIQNWFLMEMLWTIMF